MGDTWPETWPYVNKWVDELHIFDPNGDVLIQLEKKTRVATRIETTSAHDKILDPKEAVEEPLIPQESSAIEPTVNEDPPRSQSPTRATENAAPDSGSTRSELKDDTALEDTGNIYLRVSSKHLILASAMFKLMLGSGTFSEGQELLSQGNLVLKLSDDPDAMIILMYIVHGQMRNAPRNIPLQMLAKVAHLVNYYQLHAAVDLFSDTWTANLRQKAFPKSYDLELVLPWLFISWVFHKRDDFKEMTRILVRGSNEMLLDDVEREGVPIPASIVCRIQKDRNEAIGCTITVVHDHISRYFTTNVICSSSHRFACDATALGSLLKSSMAIGIWPRPEAPYHGMTFCSLVSKVQKMQVLDDCSLLNRNYYDSGMQHGIGDAIRASVESLEDQFCGLNLDSFLPERQRQKKDR